MQRKTLMAVALAAGSLVGMAAQATPAVVAGTQYGPPAYTYPSGTYSYPSATVYSSETIAVAPPAPIYEAVPATREGYVWAPGHYVFEGGRYRWRGGEWMAARPGYAYQSAHWEQRSDGSWYLVGGTWVRTDNYASYDSGRRGPFGDRDGDGVINRDDRYPRDPSRW